MRTYGQSIATLYDEGGSVRDNDWLPPQDATGHWTDSSQYVTDYHGLGRARLPGIWDE